MLEMISENSGPLLRLVDASGQFLTENIPKGDGTMPAQSPIEPITPAPTTPESRSTDDARESFTSSSMDDSQHTDDGFIPM